MGIGYAIFMSVGWLLVRVPADDWQPPNPPQASPGATGSGPAVSAAQAIKLPQFWLLWVVLCFNVTAGIGILEKAQPIYQDFFATSGPAPVIAAAAGAFVSILSLANMLGRFIWSSASDVVGRKNIYRMYLGVGALLYLVILLFGEGNKVLFLIASMLILSFYGAGFATVPAYLKDLFGTYQVGAIHGRLLTAWSAAGVLGPLIVNAVVEAQGDVAGPSKYTVSLHDHDRAAGHRVRRQRAHPSRRPEVLRARLRARRRRGRRGVRVRVRPQPGGVPMTAGRAVLTVVVWLWVVIPFLYGVWSLLQNVGALF